MKKDNKLVPYKEKKKNTKKENQLIPSTGNKVVPVKKKGIPFKKLILPILIIIVVIVIITFIFSLLNPSNKAQKYLEQNGYVCNKQTCTKEDGNTIYTFNSETLSYYIENDIYYANVGTEAPSLTLKKDEYVCTYTADEYKPFTQIDNTFIYNQMCEKYVESVNKHISEYEKIITSAKINVNR